MDIPIQKLQQLLHKRLMQAWGLDATVTAQNKLYECYGRSYRNKRDNSYIAEVYTTGNEYKEVFWNDALHAISFFGAGSSIKTQVSHTTDVHLVFFVNLAKLKPDIAHRADEELRTEIIEILGRYNYGFTYSGVETGIENVLKEYPGSYRNERLKYVDMHPVHCFRLNFTLNYNLKNC